MMEVSDAIAEVRTPVAFSLPSKNPICFCRILLYKAYRTAKVTLVPRIPKLSFLKKEVMEKPRATKHMIMQYHLISVSIQDNFARCVVAGIYSNGNVRIPNTLAKKIENTGCIPPEIQEPIQAVNIKMQGRLYLRSFINPLCFFCSSFHSFISSSLFSSYFLIFSIIYISYGSRFYFREQLFLLFMVISPIYSNSCSNMSSSISISSFPSASASADYCLAQKLA